MIFRQPIGWRLATSTIAFALSLVALYGAKVGMPFTHRLTAAEIQHDQGFSYTAKVQQPALAPIFRRIVDTTEQPIASRAQLFENGNPLRWKHEPHDSIRDTGRGAFSDWDGLMYFSASDNSDPRKNGRIYELRDRSRLNVNLSRWTYRIAGLWILAVWVQYLVARTIAAARSRGIRLRDVLRETAALRTVKVAAAMLAAVFLSGVASLFLRGMSFWVTFFAGMVFGLLALRQLLILAGLLRGQATAVSWIPNLALVVVSIGLCVVAFEGYLAWLESAAVRAGAATAAISGIAPATTVPHELLPVVAPTTRETGVVANETVSAASGAKAAFVTLPRELLEEMKQRQQLLSLPPEWEMTPIEIPGAKWAFTWHGVIHVHDENGFRRLMGPFAEKRPDTMRVMVVGDSLTYGHGIREEWTYTAQLERAMRKAYRIEFINLGREGAQSEDITRVIERMLPVLKPDLVIYGVCHNDFLPANVGQYTKEYPFPLPKRLKNYLRERTRFARFVTDSYQSMLLLLGLSMDFYDDILKDFDGYQRRFASDVKRMNEFVRSSGLPPIVGMLLDQYVIVGDRGHRISRVAEKLMREPGFEVISIEGYYQRYNGRRFTVSRWEDHPDEEANAIFAAMLYDHLRQRPDVQRFATGPN